MNARGGEGGGNGIGDHPALIAGFRGNMHALSIPLTYPTSSVLACYKWTGQANGAYNVHISFAYAHSTLYPSIRVKFVLGGGVNRESH